MLTGKLRNQVDKIWLTFFAGGITNPLSVIEQFSFLLFIRRLDDIHTLKEKAANAFGTPIEQPVFAPEQDAYRWHKFKNIDPQLMFELVRDKIFPFIKTLHGEESAFAQHMTRVGELEGKSNMQKMHNAFSDKFVGRVSAA